MWSFLSQKVILTIFSPHGMWLLNDIFMVTDKFILIWSFQVQCISFLNHRWRSISHKGNTFYLPETLTDFLHRFWGQGFETKKSLRQISYVGYRFGRFCQQHPSLERQHRNLDFVTKNLSHQHENIEINFLFFFFFLNL